MPSQVRFTIAVLATIISLTGTVRAQEAPKQPAAADDNPLTRTDVGEVPPADHLFGDWGGLRNRLADRGVDLTLGYTTESVINTSGGLRSGAASAYQVDLGIDVDWEQLAGLTGFSTHTSFINRGGRNASAEYVGDPVIQAQEIYGAGFGVGVKLVWFYGEQKLFDDRVDWTFGRLAPGTDFAASPLYCNFMTLTICGHDRALTANQGFEDWPMSVWGSRIRVRPTDHTYIMAGVFQSQPFPTPEEPYTQGGHNGWNWTFEGTTGVSTPVELAYEPEIGPDRLPGHYKIGFNWDTSTYPDNYFGVNGMPLALTGLPGKPHHGRAQFWVTADQMVMRHGPDSNDGLILIATYAHDQSDTTLFDDFFWFGFTDQGFWLARPHDRINFGFTYYTVSPKLTATQRLQQAQGLTLSGGALGVQTNAAVLELSYGAEIKPGLLLQPVLEYFIRPGATDMVPNAFLVGLKTSMNF